MSVGSYGSQESLKLLSSSREKSDVVTKADSALASTKGTWSAVIPLLLAGMTAAVAPEALRGCGATSGVTGFD